VALFLLAPLLSHAAQPFVVEKIEIQGLQKISRGTVFNYLPVEIGERVDARLTEDIIRALFKTGFFNDVALSVDGHTLIIKVAERATIANVSFTGNKDIDEDQLGSALKDIGLAVGRVFNRSLLARVEQELRQIYFSRGKYGVKIKSTVEALDANRVNVKIDIIEGQVAKIEKINIIGNKTYSERELVDKFKLSTPTMFSFLTGNDQYSEQKLRGDLEALKSYYLDRGFVNFSIDSTQVTITPDKKYILIAINVEEGAQFSVSDVKIAGELVVPKEKLLPMIHIDKGDIFSRNAAIVSQEKIRDVLGNQGYAFATVNVVTEINAKDKTVSLTFFVDPNKRVYVRRINIAGNQKTRDEVIRRELRQMEGAWLSTVNLNRSRTRLMLLGFFDEVAIETPRVPGVSDQVDVKMKVTERPSGNMIASLGYQPGEGAIFNISFNWDNFLGTGKRIAATLNNSDVTKVYNFSYSNPYYTMSGVSRALNVYFEETDTAGLDIIRHVTNVYGVGMNYGIPLSEFDRLRLGLIYENSSFEIDHDNINGADLCTAPQTYCDFEEDAGNEFDIFKIETGWSHNTRNRAIFPNRGSLQSINAELSVPGSQVNYYKLRYRHVRYVPMSRYLTFVMDLAAAYGDGYQDTNGLPFFENYFAGGERSVRGYRTNTLGPRGVKQCFKKELDSNNEPTGNQVPGDNCQSLAIGGNSRLLAGLELQFPPPFSPDSKSTRFSLFVDSGNVYQLDGENSEIDLDQLRYAAGFALTWLTPIGPLTFSYAEPFNDQPGDELKSFQFTIGVPL